MKETIQVKIIEEGKAMEVNPFGEKPVMSSFLWDRKHINLDTEQVLQLFEVNYNHWEMAEINLRTFEIVSEIKNPESPCSISYVVNYIRQAKILDNGKIEII